MADLTEAQIREILELRRRPVRPVSDPRHPNGPTIADESSYLDPSTVAALCNMALRTSDAEAKIAEQAEEIERLRKEVGRKDAALLAFASDANWRQGAAFDPNGPAFCGIGIASAALAEIGSGK